jgi:hypothetical protein
MLINRFVISVYLLEGFGLPHEKLIHRYFCSQKKTPVCRELRLPVIHSSQYPHFLRPHHKLHPYE